MFNKINLKNKNAFSLAEMMIVMLIVTLVLAAMTPTITKRAKKTANTGITKSNLDSMKTEIINEIKTMHGKQRFTSSGYFTVPANVNTVWVTAVGGGGGGIDSARGGNGEVRYTEPVSVTPNSNIYVTVGTGGVGGRVNRAYGQIIRTPGSGGDSIFLNITAKGGGKANIAWSNQSDKVNYGTSYSLYGLQYSINSGTALDSNCIYSMGGMCSLPFFGFGGGYTSVAGSGSWGLPGNQGFVLVEW